MNFNQQRAKFIWRLGNNYNIQEIKLFDLIKTYDCLYAFAFIKQYNHLAINPKLYLAKGAFGNLGFYNKNTLKFTLDIHHELILWDVKTIEPSCLAELLSSRFYGRYLGILVGKNQCQTILITKKLQESLTAYFTTDYKSFDEVHCQVLDDFLSYFLSLKLYLIVQSMDIQDDKLKFYIISPKSTYPKNELNNNDRIKIPFIKPYLDYSV